MDALVEFAPNAPPDTPGVLLEVSDLIPTARGYKARPSAQSAGYAALSEAANSLAVVTKLDGSRRVFAGTAAALYEASGGSWVDRSAVGGYSIGANRWHFAQFGDDTLAAAKAQTLQRSTTGAFAAVSGAPKASLIDTAGGFIMLCDTNEGTYGDQADRWWCSGYLDYASWTPSVTTQCTTGRLIDVPGPVLALKALGGGFVAYKRTGMWVASYVGPPSVWQWTQVPGEIGCAMPDAVVSIGAAHAFISRDDIYLFDGARPVPVAGAKLREWFFAQLSGTYAHRTIGSYDPIAGNVWWHYVSTSAPGSTPDRALVYNVPTGRFGLALLSVEAAAIYYQPGITFDGFGSAFATFDTDIDLSFDSPVWTATRPDAAYIDTSHVLQALTGPAGASGLTTGNIGDDDRFSTLTAVRPRFLVEPATATLEHLYDDLYGDAFTSLGTVGLYEGKWDTLWSSRWHRFRLAFTGDMELAGITPRLTPDGES
jgi:hypothetical protein